GRTPELTVMRLEQVASELLAMAEQGEVVRQGRRIAHMPKGAYASAVAAPGDGAAQAAWQTEARLQAPEPRHPLLESKLHVPRPRAQLVPRPHLVERVQQGMSCPLTLLSAPVGFGKTTLLVEWLARSGMACAWLTLEAKDNEPVRYFSYLLAALQRLHPALGSGARVLLDAPQPLAMEQVLAVLANELLASKSDDFALVLDDYHLIETEAIHQGMAFLLDRLPPQLHLVLATRTDPPLPLARLRARGQLVEIRAAELRF